MSKRAGWWEECGTRCQLCWRRFHEARLSGEGSVTIWGTGTPRREFLHVDDLADACLFLLDRFDEPGPINVGAGKDLPIGELAELVRDVLHPSAEILHDTTKPDGMPRKLLDTSRMEALGWHASIPLREGVEATYRWFESSHWATARPADA